MVIVTLRDCEHVAPPGYPFILSTELKQVLSFSTNTCLETENN